MYVIITDSRKNNEILFMVNRKIQKKSFWSNRIDEALIYHCEKSANRKAISLKFNNPRVISHKNACEIDYQQNKLTPEELHEIAQESATLEETQDYPFG